MKSITAQKSASLRASNPLTVDQIKKTVTQVRPMEKEYSAYKKHTIRPFYMFLREVHPLLWAAMRQVREHMRSPSKPVGESERIRLMVGVRCGWFEGWTPEKAEKKTTTDLAKGFLVSHQMFELPPAQWCEYVCKCPLPELPDPLPFIPGQRKLGGNNDAYVRAVADTKAKVNMSTKEAILWVYKNMSREGLGQDHMPAGICWTYYKISQGNPHQFIEKYASQYLEEEASRESQRMEWMRDDNRRFFRIINEIVKDKSEV